MEMSVGMGLAEFGGVAYVCDAGSRESSSRQSLSEESFDSEHFEDCLT